MGLSSIAETQLDGSTVRLTYEDGSVVDVAFPVTSWRRDDVAIWMASGHSIAPFIDPAASDPTARLAAVDIERDRRIALGVAYGGHTYQTRDFDIANMTGAATAAVAAMMQGAQAGDLRWTGANADFAWIALDNTLVPMDAPTLIGLAQAAMNRRAAMIFAARAIKNQVAAGVALTITDDALWPA